LPVKASDEPLRILFAPSAYYPHVGGIEEVTRQLALVLRGKGHEVAVTTNLWPDGLPPSETLDRLRVTRLRFPLPSAHPVAAARFIASAPAAAFAVVRHVRRWQPTVIHVIGAGPPSVYLASLHAVLGAHLVFSAAGELTFDALGAFERSATLRAGLRQVLRKADAVTACSAFVMRDLERVAKIDGPSFVIPNGVDELEFADGPPADDLGNYVLAVGRLVPQKGFDVLVDAFASDMLPALDLVFAGDGFERRRLEDQVARLGLGSRVRFLGSVDRSRLSQLLRGARVFAFPSRGEAFGIALLEAMAAGVPAVATAAGGIPELARDGENALLVQPDDRVALAQAIRRLATNTSLRERLVLGGRKTAAELSWSRIASRYENVYARVLRGADA
jgi:glycogen(starch) synthase